MATRAPQLYLFWYGRLSQFFIIRVLPRGVCPLWCCLGGAHARCQCSFAQANVKSAAATAHLASQFLEPGGLLVFSGAGAARGPTPGMAGYGMAKAATHQLAR